MTTVKIDFVEGWSAASRAILKSAAFYKNHGLNDKGKEVLPMVYSVSKIKDLPKTKKELYEIMWAAFRHGQRHVAESVISKADTMDIAKYLVDTIFEDAGE